MFEFNERLNQTRLIEDKMKELFPKSVVREFGYQTIIGDDIELKRFMNNPEINQMASGMIVKFAPDFILLKKETPQQLFFVDVKHSVSPVWAYSRLNKIREKNKDYTLEISDIAVVAREALLSYRRYYPNSIVLMASPYNPKLLMAQFASRIQCLYCYRSDGQEYECNNCPSKNGTFFDIERATNSQGSQTPMTDVDLRSFEPVEVLFSKLGIGIDSATLSSLKLEIKKERILFGKNVDESKVNHVLWELNKAGCEWIDYTLFSKEGNAFLHIDQQCNMLKSNSNSLLRYSLITEARKSGRYTICKYCGKKY